jgi:hypothetical protein
MVKSEPLKSEAQELNRFLSIYEQQQLVEDKGCKIVLGRKDNKQCRFCGRVAPDVTFKKKAHVLSQLLGNRNITSFFECDSCNEDIFSSYESSLAAFVGVIRTFAEIKGQKGIPKYKDKKTSLRVEFTDGMVTMSAKASEIKGKIDIDKETKQVTIRTTADSYYPIRVYKSLAKIAYCLFDEEELSDFKFVHELLMSNEDERFRGLPFIRLFWSFLTNGVSFNKPSAVLFTRRPRLDNPFFPEKALLIRSANSMYQIFLLSDRDIELAKSGQSFTCIRFPMPTDQYHFGHTDLSAPDKKIGEKRSYVFSFESIKKV